MVKLGPRIELEFAPTATMPKREAPKNTAAKARRFRQKGSEDRSRALSLFDEVARLLSLISGRDGLILLLSANVRRILRDFGDPNSAAGAFRRRPLETGVLDLVGIDPHGLSRVQFDPNLSPTKPTPTTSFTCLLYTSPSPRDS